LKAVEEVFKLEYKVPDLNSDSSARPARHSALYCKHVTATGSFSSERHEVVRSHERLESERDRIIKEKKTCPNQVRYIHNHKQFSPPHRSSFCRAEPQDIHPRISISISHERFSSNPILSRSYELSASNEIMSHRHNRRKVPHSVIGVWKSVCETKVSITYAAFQPLVVIDLYFFLSSKNRQYNSVR